jgi:hypothetical protein
MNLCSDKIRILTICVGLSVLTHLLLLFPLGKLGSYNFARPVNPLHAVMVDLKRPGDGARSAKEAVGQETSDTANVEGDAKNDEDLGTARDVAAAIPATGADKSPNESEPARDGVATNSGKADASPQRGASTNETLHAASLKTSPVFAIKPPLRTAGEFLATEREKLTYQISMFGLPVGIAELEAKNEGGEVRITLRVKSNSVLSTLYPVDDFVETRHINGNFILTRIRQQEGSFRSDRGITIMLREKKVFWIDRLKNRSTTEPIPNGEVLDIISGLYYLRNRPLQVGKTELLQIYDSDTYAPLPVEVKRREQVRLPGFRKADTIVIKPLLKTDGIFKRTGDVTIWLTDDDFRVPVKVETQIPLGKVTAELVSADTQTYGAPSAGGTTPEKNESR